jgi:hypothetical protein
MVEVVGIVLLARIDNRRARYARVVIDERVRETEGKIQNETCGSRTTNHKVLQAPRSAPIVSWM